MDQVGPAVEAETASRRSTEDRHHTKWKGKAKRLEMWSWNVKSAIQETAQICIAKDCEEIDIVALQELRIEKWSDYASDTHEFFSIPGTIWKNQAGAAVGGLGFLVRKAVAKRVYEAPVNYGQRVGILKLGIGSGRKLVVINAYAPIEKASGSEKSKFYSQLQRAISDVRTIDLLVLCGDFNAEILAADLVDKNEGGAEKMDVDECEFMHEVAGPFSLGRHTSM